MLRLNWCGPQLFLAIFQTFSTKSRTLATVSVETRWVFSKLVVDKVLADDRCGAYRAWFGMFLKKGLSNVVYLFTLNQHLNATFSKATSADHLFVASMSSQ